MIRCYHCGTDNLDGSEYCDECGTKLNTASNAQTAYAPPSFQAPMSVQSAAPPVPPPPPTFTQDTVSPKPATPYTPPPPPVFQPLQSSDQTNPTAVSAPSTQTAKPSPGTQSGLPAAPGLTSVAGPSPTATFNGPTGNLRGNPFDPNSSKQASMNAAKLPGSEIPAIRAKLVIQRGGKIGKEFPIASVESMIGRWDADGGIFPDIDLDQDDPEAKVSRRHARIQFANNQYLIEDLGSTNGTFINRGPRLLPGIKQPLNNGDEIIVGKTFLKFVLS